jgi:hypothetical protein
MKILASCNGCKAPQGVFTSEEKLEKDIKQRKECWHCNESFISNISDKIINLNRFFDTEEQRNEFLSFWNDDNWEENYKKWMKDERKFEINDEIETHYIHVSKTIRDQFEKSPFWTELCKNLNEFHGEYRLKSKDYNLLLNLKPPELDVKSFDSSLLKSFRKNILNNENLTEEPETGWILPNKWYSQINDIVRTSFVVKYLDGVNFLADKIETICQEQNIEYITEFEAKDEGYYAAHLSILHEFKIPTYTWKSARINVWIEIQITTQLQEVIKQLLHKYYEKNRKKNEEKDVKWQWDYKNEEFSMNYLGHILHYVEGMIMEIRDKQEREEYGK